jgi:hypothetical protein
MEDVTVLPGALAAEERRRSASIAHGDAIVRRDLGVYAHLIPLPAHSNRLPRTKRLPRGLFGMVALVITIECVACHFGSGDFCRSHLPLSWRKSSQAADDPGAYAEILCFGDSQVKLGVLPLVVEASLGHSAYNLAVLAGQPASSFFLFRQVLERGHRPRAVIVDFSAPLLTMSIRANLDGWAELASWRDAIELALESSDPSVGLAIASRWLVSTRSRQSLLRPARTARQLHDPATDLVEDHHVFERNWCQNRGAQVAPRQFVPIEGALPKPPMEDSYKWRPQPVHAAYIARFLSLARSHDIPVFWVLPPVIAGRRERLESSGIVAAHTAFVSSFLAPYPGVTILDGTDLGWDIRAFRDPIHLNRDGAVAFSLAVARAVSRRLGRANDPGLPRWDALNATLVIAAYPWENCLEDLDQSRAALVQQGRLATAKEGSKWSRMPTGTHRRAAPGAT